MCLPIVGILGIFLHSVPLAVHSVNFILWMGWASSSGRVSYIRQLGNRILEYFVPFFRCDRAWEKELPIWEKA